MPASVRKADLVHLHWLELWGRPPYQNLAGLAQWGPPGRLLRRWLVPPLNSRAVFARRRRSFLERFLHGLADYRKQGGRVVYSIHNLGQHEGEADRIESEGLSRLLTLADAVHVHSHAMAAELQARFDNTHTFRVIEPDSHAEDLLRGDEEGKPTGSSGRPVPLATIPHGNYVGAYPNQVGRQTARSRLGLPADAFIYLFLGLIRPYKGLEMLLPVFGALPDANVRLLIAGQSRPSDYAEGLVARTVGDSRVHWHPQFVPVDEVQLWMNASDIVVLPYHRVTTSGAALLSFSFGKPVIAPALDAFVELMGNRASLGRLYEPTDPHGLAQALQDARTIDWRLHEREILAWVQQFDWLKISRQFVALYERVRNDERRAMNAER